MASKSDFSVWCSRGVKGLGMLVTLYSCDCNKAFVITLSHYRLCQCASVSFSVKF